MDNMHDVPTHLHDHNYWRRELSRSQMSTSTSTSTSTTVAAESRKKQECSSRALMDPPEERRREDAAVPLDRSPSAQPFTSAPQARLESVQLEKRTAGERHQEIQPRALQEPGGDLQQDDVRPTAPWLSGLSPSAFNTVAEMLIAWLTESAYDPEM